MGLLISKILDKLSGGPRDTRIIMIGLDAAGKTTILYKLKLGDVIHSTPTIGFNVESVIYKTLKFNVFDIGGQFRIRQLWHHYYEHTDAIIYVLDSSDDDRFEEARQTLESVLADEQLNNAPLLLFANKQDVTQHSAAEIAEKMKLFRQKGREWYVQGTCALNGEGLYEGLEWLHNTIKKQRKNTK